MKELAITLSHNDERPMYEQIYIFIKNEILSGGISRHEKLPSTRGLAKHLSVSRSTVIMAYEQLLSEGYIYTKNNSGNYVSDVRNLHHIKNKISDGDTSQKSETLYKYDFSPRGIDLSVFPVNVWRKLTKNVLSDENRELFNSGDKRGDAGLRESICRYLHQSRGVNASSENIIVGAGNDYLMMILLQLIPEKSVYAFEENTYVKSAKICESMGRKVAAVSYDEKGIDVKKLEESGADICYVMPSHQFPTGTVMPVNRRMELLKWANEGPGRYIIEDDYDSEFRYKGRPIPSLQSQDGNGKIIYIGTFSKSIGPALRMSYMVLPKDLMIRYLEEVNFYSCSVSRIDQRIANAFISEGYFERHLNRMRAHYKLKHDRMLELLKPFEKKFHISGDNSGTHFVLTSKDEISDKKLKELAGKEGVNVYAVSESAVRKKESVSVVLGYAGIEESKLEEGVKRLMKAWNIPT